VTSERESSRAATGRVAIPRTGSVAAGLLRALRALAMTPAPGLQLPALYRSKP